ncbi:MAG: hypothetical protein AAFY83_08505 [Pseudomonadota bacterium]
MHSPLFYSSERYRDVEARLLEFLNAHDGWLSVQTAKSTRAVGDSIEDILSESFAEQSGLELKNYTADFARRAMADLAFEDLDDYYYIVDVKTHRVSTKFNMPNLTSVERLARFYEAEKNYFTLMIVVYDVVDTTIKVEKIHFIPIEFLSWDCLTIGALGWGQIQIANSNNIVINPGFSRRNWMIQMCDTLLEFYPKEILKIDKRIEHFRKIREKWEDRSE